MNRINENLDIEDLSITIRKNKKKKQFSQDIGFPECQSQNIADENKIFLQLKYYVEDVEDVEDLEDLEDVEDVEDVEDLDELPKCQTQSVKNCNQQENNQIYERKTFEYQSLDEQYKICQLFGNDNTNVELKYNPEQKSFIVLKENKGDSSFSVNEQKILKQLEDQNITFKMISQKENSFEQIAGKTNLLLLRENISNRHLFETFFLILMDKLNKMHKIGVVHSDIKPQNILISFDNEPFFIDFDGSVLLKDYTHYLQNYTRNFNLKIYLKEKQEGKKFTNEEEIKLCDRTQLCLTFLFLFCKDENQLIWFKNKNLNELLKSLIDKDNQNGNLIVSIISRILNQADSKINIIDDEKKISFMIKSKILNEEIQKSNDIVFIEQKNAYNVKSINKFSIYLIYFLDKNSETIYIKPSQMKIIPQPQLQEYQYIYQKYNQIEYYHQKILNGSYLSDNDLYNICEYLKVSQNRNRGCTIQIDNKEYCLKLFQNISKFTNSLEITIAVDSQFLFEFIDFMKQEKYDYYIQKFHLTEIEIYCKLGRYSDQKLKKSETQLKISVASPSLFKYPKQFNYIIKNYQITLVKIFTNYFDHDSNFLQQLQDLIHDLLQKTKSKQQENKFEFRVKIAYRFSFEYQDLLKLEILKDKEHYHINNQRDQINATIFEIEEQKFKYKKSVDINNFLADDTMFPDLKKIICQKGDELIIRQTLQITQKIERICKKLTIKFFNHLFSDTKIWLEFLELIQNNENQIIELIVVNCQFTKNIFEILKHIKSFPQVNYEFQNDYSLKSDEFQNKVGNYIYIQQNTKQEKGFTILFFQSFSAIKQEFYANYQKVDKENLFNSKEKKEIIQINIDGLQNILKNQQKLKDLNLGELQIPINKQINVIKIFQNNNLRLKTQNKDTINLILQKLNNNRYFNEIEINIDNQANMFIYNEKYLNGTDSDYEDEDENENEEENLSPYIFFKYKFDSNQSQLLNQFYELFIAIYNSYSYLSIINKACYLMQEIYLTKSYSFYEISYKFNCNVLLKNNSSFEIGSKFLNDDNSEVSICQEFSVFNCYSQTQSISCNIKEEIHKGDFIKNFKNHLNQYCLNNSIIYSYLLENKSYKLSFKFCSLKLDDLAYKILIFEFEELFLNRQKVYEFDGPELTKQTLQNIYEFIKIYQQQQNIIRFELFYHNMSFSDFNQFLMSIDLDNQNHEISYEIRLYDEKLSELYFDGKSKEEYYYLILEYQPLTSESKLKSKFQICLEFNLIDFLELFQSNIKDQNFGDINNQQSSKKQYKNEIKYKIYYTIQDYKNILNPNSNISFEKSEKKELQESQVIQFKNEFGNQEQNDCQEQQNLYDQKDFQEICQDKSQHTQQTNNKNKNDDTFKLNKQIKSDLIQSSIKLGKFIKNYKYMSDNVDYGETLLPIESYLNKVNENEFQNIQQNKQQKFDQNQIKNQNIDSDCQFENNMKTRVFNLHLSDSECLTLSILNQDLLNYQDLQTYFESQK